jgi:hypothetical protein
MPIFKKMEKIAEINEKNGEKGRMEKITEIFPRLRFSISHRLRFPVFLGCPRMLFSIFMDTFFNFQFPGLHFSISNLSSESLFKAPQGPKLQAQSFLGSRTPELHRARHFFAAFARGHEKENFSWPLGARSAGRSLREPKAAKKQPHPTKFFPAGSHSPKPFHTGQWGISH